MCILGIFSENRSEYYCSKSRMGGTDPESWWENLKLSTQAIMTESGVSAAEIKAIGISYQMHGLVCVDKNQHVLRPAIIFGDSRAVPYGQKAFETIGEGDILFSFVELTGEFYCFPSWRGLKKTNRPSMSRLIR